MYIVNWNEEENTLEASLGGNVTVGEAQVFADAIVHELGAVPQRPFTYKLDYSKANRVDEGVLEAFHVAQVYCRLRGATKYVCVARTQTEVEYIIGLRLQQVLEGEEEYQLAAA
ncbi:MAG: hypothetical protein JNM85_07845 [Chthonomonas sp.]|nr:hypothetical protein [Chthonomonas sp.]